MSESSMSTSVFTYDTYDEAMKKYKSQNNYKSIFTHSYMPLCADGEMKEFPEPSSCVLKFFRASIIVIFYIFAIMLFPFSICICIKKIRSLERLVVLRLGKLQPVVGPGYCFILPFIDKWYRVDLQPKSFDIPTQQILISDGAIVEVLATVKYSVTHVIDYVLKLHRQEKSIQALVEHCFRNLLSEEEQRALELNRHFISSSLKSELNKTILPWGVEILDIIMPPVKVLKEAEPVNALAQVINALKGVSMSGQGNDIIFPLAEVTASSNSIRGSYDSHSINNGIQQNMLKTITELIKEATDRNVFAGVCANYKLTVLGNETTVIFISIQDGVSSITDCASGPCEEDVSVILTEDDVKDFMLQNSSPIDAYMDGRIQVFGNWNLLKHFAEIFSLDSKF